MPPAADLIEAAAQTIKLDNFQRILIRGSAPNSLQAVNWPRELFDKIVVINNAWRVRGDWDDIIYPYDFARENMPPHIEPYQQIVDEHIFVTALCKGQNNLSTEVY